MARVSMRITNDRISTSLRRIVDRMEEVPARAYDKFRATTPKRTGNARSKTNLRGNTIQAGYNYASRLDAGSSRQAPQGMTKPTREFIKRLVKSIMRK